MGSGLEVVTSFQGSLRRAALIVGTPREDLDTAEEARQALGELGHRRDLRHLANGVDGAQHHVA